MIGCSDHTLLEWVKKAEVNSGKRAGVPTELADRLKALECENRERWQANEILRKASAYFVQAELDCSFKRWPASLMSIVAIDPVPDLHPTGKRCPIKVTLSRRLMGWMKQGCCR